MSTITNLQIDKMAEGFEFDMLIATEVLGWPMFLFDDPLPYTSRPRPHFIHVVTRGPDSLQIVRPNGDSDWWSPTTQIQDAWEVVNTICSKDPTPIFRPFYFFRDVDGTWGCYFTVLGPVRADGSQGCVYGVGRGPTAPLAICRSALDLVTRKETTDDPDPERRNCITPGLERA